MALPEKLAPGIYRVDGIAFRAGISIFLLAASDGWTMIDTGLPGSVRRIQAALHALGADRNALRRIYLTHHHLDHTGGLPGLHAWAPEAEIVAAEGEAAIIAGSRPPDARPNAALNYLTQRQPLPHVPVDRTVREGDLVAGCRVIATPGHTFGHTSLLHEEHGLLFTGDAFGALLGQVRVGVAKLLCSDPAAARRSAEKLLGFDYATVALSHGAPLREDARARLRAATARCDWA